MIVRKFFIFVFCLSLGVQYLLAQTPADSISSTSPKFLVYNEQKQVLLIYDKSRQAWEVPGSQYVGPISFKELVDQAAREFGITYDQIGLGGLFTYHYLTRYKTVIRPYFTMRFSNFINGKNFNQAAQYKWVNIKDVRKTVFYPASVMIVEKIMQEPKTIWAAAFEEFGYTNPMVDASKVKFRVIEPFYKLNEN